MASNPDMKKTGTDDVQLEMAPHHAGSILQDKAESGLAEHQEVPKTPEEIRQERRLLWKIDLIILPLVSIMYFLASLDRGDIGVAAVAGMTKDLMLSSQMLSTCASIFYVGYIVLQLPGDIFLKKFTPPRQLAFALCFWGTFTALLCTAKSYSQVVGLRFLIGVGEAFLQAGVLYLTLWYKRHEIATRISIVFATSAVAGAFNGIIGYGITKNMNGALGYAAWQWIFLIEGVISVAYGIIIYFFIPPAPEHAKWGFNQRERDQIVRRTKEAYNVTDTKIHLGHIWALFKSPKPYCYIIMYCCLNVSLASFSTFLPVILATFNFSTLEAQSLTIPCFAVAAVSTIGLSMISDRFRRRGYFTILAFSIAAAGWLILLVSKSNRLSYAGTFLIGIGTYPLVPLVQSWMYSNVIGFTKRAVMLASVNMFGQCFSIIGQQVYTDSPHYYRGNGFVLGAMVIGALTAIVNLWYVKRKNAEKTRNQDSDEARRLRVLTLEEIGEDHPDFMYYV